jgi:hypothetical protein
MRRLVAVLVLASSVACGGGAITPAPSAPSTPAASAPGQSAAEGSWKLSTVDGTPLPYTRPDTVNSRVEILSIALSIESTGGHTFGDYTETFTWRTTTRGQQFTSSGTDRGYWTLTGTAIQLLDGDGVPSAGSVTGNTMTLNTSDSRIYVYTK